MRVGILVKATLAICCLVPIFMLPGCGDDDDPVQIKPSIVLSHESLSFSATSGAANPSPQVVDITNGSSGTLADLAYATTYSTGSGWLTVSLDGTTAPAVLSVQPITAALPAGTYGATIAITCSSASNSPKHIAVTLTVAEVLLGDAFGGALLDTGLWQVVTTSGGEVSIAQGNLEVRSGTVAGGGTRAQSMARFAPTALQPITLTVRARVSTVTANDLEHFSLLFQEPGDHVGIGFTRNVGVYGTIRLDGVQHDIQLQTWDVDVWHTYSVEWSQNSVRFYIDGVPLGSYTSPGIPSQELYLWLDKTSPGYDTYLYVDEVSITRP